jgi:hypothetical protein
LLLGFKGRCKAELDSLAAMAATFQPLLCEQVEG